MKVILWNFQSNWKKSDNYIAEYGEPTYENKIKNVNANGHFGAPGLLS